MDIEENIADQECMGNANAMDNGIIPLRHSSLPGVVKLPRRFDPNNNKSTTNGVVLRQRRYSIAQPRGNTLAERIDDLTKAIIWVKQELIEMRQHDVLLKRQFFDIQEKIQRLSKPKKSPKTLTLPTGEVTKCSISRPSSTDSLDLEIENYAVRPSSSITNLAEEEADKDCESELDDKLGEGFRPRTSSMTTSRDLAARARRRGSMDLSLFL